MLTQTAGWRVVALLAVWAMPSYAQAPAESEGWAPRRGASNLLGLAYQAPEGPELSAGVIVGTVPGRQNKCIFGATSEGVLLQAHAGINGAKVSVGAARYNPAFGYGAKTSLLHLWRTSGDSPARTTYVGPELEVSVFVLRISAGLLWRTGGPVGAASRFTVGAGLGF
jgi:hypothetical protein